MPLKFHSKFRFFPLFFHYERPISKNKFGRVSPKNLVFSVLKIVSSQVLELPREFEAQTNPNLRKNGEETLT